MRTLPSLFAGAMFPISQLPRPFRVIAYVTPLYHGVALSRSFALHTLDAASAGKYGRANRRASNATQPSRNASKSRPAKLLAVFVVDSDDKALTTPVK